MLPLLRLLSGLKQKNTMQKNTIATKNYTLTFTKEIGKLWILKDFTPLGKNFARFFDENLGHDIGKLMTVGCPNYVLDRLQRSVWTFPAMSNLSGWILAACRPNTM